MCAIAVVDSLRLLLREHEGSPSTYKKLSELQAGAVAHMVTNAVLNAEEKVEVANLIVQVKWAADADCSRVLSVIQADEPVVPQKKRRA